MGKRYQPSPDIKSLLDELYEKETVTFNNKEKGVDFLIAFSKDRRFPPGYSFHNDYKGDIVTLTKNK